jgi:hypothetical protein
MSHGEVLPWACRSCGQTTLRWTGTDILCWNQGCPEPGFTSLLLAGTKSIADDLLEELVWNGGEPHIDPRSDHVNVQLDLTIWQRAVAWYQNH